MPPFEMTITDNLDGTISRKIEKGGGRTRQWDYEYDEAGRLTRALLDHGTAFWCEYDREGRRDHDVVTFRKDKVRSYSYGPDNRLQTAGNIRFEHDQAGFRCGRIQPDGKAWRYHYNPDYQLLGATLPDGRVLSYEHDGEGLRIGKYVDGQLAEAYDWENSLQMARFAAPLGVAEFHYEQDQRMPFSMERNGIEYALYYDQIGSLRAVADPLDNVIKEVLYSPFGAVIEDTNPGFSIPLGFAGGLFDGDLGFVRFGWRDYDTDTARWTAKDPIGATGGDEDWYGYCLNDPVNGVDPEGLKGKYAGADSEVGLVRSKCPSGVWRCSRPADILGGIVDHHWIKTNNIEAGLGEVGQGAPGNETASPYVTETRINDHTGQSQRADSSCECIEDVNATRVEEMMTIGRPTGKWTFTNTCQSLVRDVLDKSKKETGPMGNKHTKNIALYTIVAIFCLLFGAFNFSGVFFQAWLSATPPPNNYSFWMFLLHVILTVLSAIVVLYSAYKIIRLMRQ